MCRMHFEELHLLLDLILHSGLLPELQKPSQMFKRKKKGEEIQDLEKYMDTLTVHEHGERTGLVGSYWG